jgi:hypothetical protein
VGVVEALAERAVDGGVIAETGVTGETVVGVVPRMPATAFFCAAVGAGGEDEQAAMTNPAKKVRIKAQRLRGLIASDRLVSSCARSVSRHSPGRSLSFLAHLVLAPTAVFTGRCRLSFA